MQAAHCPLPPVASVIVLHELGTDPGRGEARALQTSEKEPRASPNRSGTTIRGSGKAVAMIYGPQLSRRFRRTKRRRNLDTFLRPPA